VIIYKFRCIFQAAESKFKRNIFWFCVILLILTIFRNGMSIYGLMWRNFESGHNDLSDEKGFEYKKLQDFQLSSLLLRLGSYLGAPLYFSLYAVIIIASIVIIVKQLSNLGLTESQKFRSIFLISLLPSSTIILQRFGTFDTICILMSFIGILSKYRVASFLSALVFTSTNIEASFVSGLSLLLLSYSGIKLNIVDLKWPKNAKVFGLVQMALSIPLMIIDVISNSENNLKSIFLIDSKYGLAQLLVSGPLLLYSWFGAYWYFLYKITFYLKAQLVDRILVIIFAIGCGTLIAADGTRNSVLGLTSLAVCILFSNIGIKCVTNLKKSMLIGLFFIPAINVSNFNIVLPFYQLLYLFDLARPYLITN
jgi:hypothetical protein